MPKYSAAQKRAYAKRMAKVRRNIRGKGDYKFRAARDLGIAGGAVGNIFGGKAGARAGEIAGGLLGKLFKSVTGIGDYEVKSNSLLGKGGAVPDFGKSAVRICHKEFLQNIDSTTAFNILEFPLNPGMSETFPWLSPIAQQFENYRLNGCIVYYKSTSADALNSTNSALGKVVCAVDYNSSDATWVNIQQMYGSQYATSGPPSSDLMAAVECDERFLPHNNMLYVRSGAPNTGSNILQYDHGKLQVATDASQAAATVGELWIAYDVTLVNPVMNNVLGLTEQSDKFILDPAGSVTAALKFGTPALAVVSSAGIGGTIGNGGENYSFPPELSSGTYMITWQATGASTALASFTVATANCTLVNMWNNEADIYVGTRTGTSVTASLSFVVEINDQNAVFGMGVGGTIPASTTSGDLIITKIQPL